MTVKRATRVEGRVKDEMAAELRALSDPRLAGAIVSRVEVSDDLSIARVYVRRLEGAIDERAKTSLLRGLGSAANKLKRSLARSLGLRRTPELKFFYDDAPDDIARIEEVLRDIKK